MTNLLSPEQSYALQMFEEGNNLFITGPGGTGKTFLIQHLVKNGEDRKKRVQVCALTGCASLLLNCNARTLHSWTGIKNGRGDADKIIEGIFKNKKSMKAWKTIDVLIVDEVSMLSKRIFELIDYIGKRVRLQKNKAFGGIQVIFTGDFYQLPPVGNTDEIDSSNFCFESEKWYEIFPLENHIELTTIFRQNDPVFQSILSNIRKGKINQEQIDILKKHIDRPFLPEEHNGCIPTKLFPTKSRVEEYNKYMFETLEGQSYEYGYIMKTNCKTFLDSNRAISLEELERCKHISKAIEQREIENLTNNSSCIPLLSLKKGANVMCTTNLDLDSGICNGSIGIITDFQTRMGIPIPIVQFSNGIKREIAIQYWQSEEYPTIAIGQFPLCLAWAMTIHKIQGATLSMAEMDIGRNIFENGQTYVALSRVKSLEGLYLSHFYPQNIKVNPKVEAFYSLIPEVEYEIEEISREAELNFESFSYREEETEKDIKKIKVSF